MLHRSLVPVALLAALAPLPQAVEAQAANASHTHIGHVLTSFASAPEGQGLLATADAEAAIALRHAGLAANDPTNIDPMKQHARHVLNAIDPTAFADGPGQGFGVKAAAEGIVRHIELAAAADGASAGVRTHAAHVATAARSVSQRADQIVDLARQILAAQDYLRASRLVDQMRALCEDLTTGADESGDGTVSLDEGGLQHVRQHVELMAQGEGLT